MSKGLEDIYKRVFDTHEQLAETRRDFESKASPLYGSDEYKTHRDMCERLQGRTIGLNAALGGLDPKYYTSGPWRRKAHAELMGTLEAMMIRTSESEDESMRHVRNNIKRGIAESIAAVGAAVEGNYRSLARLPQPHLEEPVRTRTRQRDRGLGDE